MTQIFDTASMATIRALGSLTPLDATAVRATVFSSGNLYRVDEHDDYDGYLSLLLTPLQDRGPGFLVSGNRQAVDVAELHGDDMIKLGSFPNIGAAMLGLRQALEKPEPRRRRR